MQKSGIFMELPDRKDLPDYFKVITNPVSLSEIEVSHSFVNPLTARIVCYRANTKRGKNSLWMWISCAQTRSRITKTTVKSTRMLGRSR